MSTHNTNKLQKLSNFDFSVEGAHVAIVSKAANGKTKFLIQKSLGDKLEKAMTPDMTWEQLEAQAMQISTTLPLIDLLEIQGIWRGDAIVIANAINKSEDNINSKEKLEKFIKGLDLEGLKGTKTNIDKTNKEKSMTTPVEKVEDPSKENIAKASEEVVAVLDLKKELETLRKAADADKLARAKLQDQVDLLKSQEDSRINKSYEAKAEALSGLDFGKADAMLLKAIDSVEGGSKILEALHKAQDILKASVDDDIKEKGHGSELSSLTAFDELQAIAKSYQAADGALSDVEALAKATANNKALYFKYTQEQGAK